MTVPRQREEMESPFISFVDLLAGSLLIFILMIVVLALHQREDPFQNSQVVAAQSASDPTTRVFFEQLKAAVAHAGYSDISIDTKAEAMILPEAILFEPNQHTLKSAKARAALNALSAALVELVSCSAKGIVPKTPCPPNAPILATVLVEGYADTTGPSQLNMSLSLQRAETVYSALMAAQPSLLQARSASSRGENQGLFGVTGYGKTRPKIPTPDQTTEPQNRRMEVRFIFDH